MAIATWLAFTIAYAIMAFTPGPVIMLIVSYALSQGRRTALAATRACNKLAAHAQTRNIGWYGF